jgi:hypothetical protein
LGHTKSTETPWARSPRAVPNQQKGDLAHGGFQRRHNVLGKRAAPCIVSHRWLQFQERSDRFEDGDYPDGDYMFVSVMTTAGDGETRKKLCTLCISKADILAALSEVDKDKQPLPNPVDPVA